MRGRHWAALAFFAMVGCERPVDGWAVDRDGRAVVLAAPVDAMGCLIIINSSEGGFHRVGEFDLSAGEARSFSLSEFANSRGAVPHYLDDALVQCRDPNVVVRLRP